MALLSGCRPATTASGSLGLAALRTQGPVSHDADLVGRWLIHELIAPGGQPKKAQEALQRLNERYGKAAPSPAAAAPLWASLALALEADLHGKFRPAAEHYLASLKALRQSAQSETPLFAWFAASRLVALRSSYAGLYEKAQAFVEQAIEEPGRLGWRARVVLVDWWSRAKYSEAAQQHRPAKEVLALVQKKHGCLTQARFAGPFGSGVVRDTQVHFAAEKPAPWPARFASQPGRSVPEVREASSYACALYLDGVVPRGVYYVQTFIDVDIPRNILLAVDGAQAVFVDDVEVATRNRFVWGQMARQGVALRLSAGRHRIVARLAAPETSVRVLDQQGQPLAMVASSDDSAPYRFEPPRHLPDPNVLEPYLRQLKVSHKNPRKRLAVDYPTEDPVHRYVAAFVAHLERQDDVASVLLEPLVKDLEKSTAAAVAQQAVFVDRDPIYARATARDLARDLRRRAVAKDPELWGAALWLTLDGAKNASSGELAQQMEKLASKFPQVASVARRLVQLYGRLGWKVEYGRALEQAASRFAENLSLQRELMLEYERRGQLGKADALAKRIMALDPGQEVLFRRALARHDYSAAIAELKRIATLRRRRRNIAIRIADLLQRAGKKRESLRKLQLALKQDPLDTAARLRLADARYAAGDSLALSNALVDAVRTGADPKELRGALELVEGATDLEPYRRDGLRVISEHQASGKALPGTAARILDYAVLLVEDDGSARMLEHEIVRVQSREGIQRHLEQKLPQGVVLKMRTIKKDGRIFEPERIAGKPTVTMPHLEVGDCIETEHIWLLPNRSGGRRFQAPRWFFREKDVSYHLSEYVVVTPASRALDIETTGDVPKPQVKHGGGLSVRRWRVEGALALPTEPGAPPMQEFLPSVRMGWGVDRAGQLERFSALHDVPIPRDPRMLRIARTLVAGKVGKQTMPKSGDTRARRIYRWVLDTIRPGQERHPARAITAKKGDRREVFMWLCRLVGVDARLALVRDRLSPPPLGPLSEAEVYSVPVVRVRSDDATRWVMLRHRYAPYGFLPSSISDQPAVIIDRKAGVKTPRPEPLEETRTDNGGGMDGVRHTGQISLASDGSAKLKLVQYFYGRYAIALRTKLGRLGRGGPARIVNQKRRQLVEMDILAGHLPGARVSRLKVSQLDETDKPVVLAFEASVPNLARNTQEGLVMKVPFLGSLARSVRLEKRQSPLYIARAEHARVELKISVPKGAKLASALASFEHKGRGITVHVRDRREGALLVVDREANLPAGRVQPSAYPQFRKLLLSASEALTSRLRLVLAKPAKPAKASKP